MANNSPEPTTKNPEPRPPLLMTSERGSFAEKTIVERKPQIIARVIADNDYPPEIVAALEAYRDEITTRPIEPLTEDADDVAFWNGHQARCAGKTWREVPWYFAETYFYRRLLEATRYFQGGEWGNRDPFWQQKREQEATAIEQLAAVWAQIEAHPPEERFPLLLHSCLWGNRADLSNFTVQESAHKELDTAGERENLLIDDTEAVREHLESCQHIAFINDNVGADSLFDLALADFLLTHGSVQRVTFYLKIQPLFVSDAMPADIIVAITQLQHKNPSAVGELGSRLFGYLLTQQLVLATGSFWTSCLSFHQMLPALRAGLSRADLVILKGDVNYRRLLDDRHWPHTTSIRAADGNFPKPYLVLRTLKGEIMVGLQPGQAEMLAQRDPTWLINGKRGLIQLVKEQTANCANLRESPRCWKQTV